MAVVATLVTLTDPANVRHWTKAWIVTEGQLRMAVGRVGIDAARVRADIFGTPLMAHPGAQPRNECFGAGRVLPQHRSASRNAVAA